MAVLVVNSAQYMMCGFAFSVHILYSSSCSFSFPSPSATCSAQSPFFLLFLGKWILEMYGVHSRTLFFRVVDAQMYIFYHRCKVWRESRPLFSLHVPTHPASVLITAALFVNQLESVLAIKLPNYYAVMLLNRKWMQNCKEGMQIWTHWWIPGFYERNCLFFCMSLVFQTDEILLVMSVTFQPSLPEKNVCMPLICSTFNSIHCISVFWLKHMSDAWAVFQTLT